MGSSEEHISMDNRKTVSFESKFATIAVLMSLEGNMPKRHRLQYKLDHADCAERGAMGSCAFV